MPMHFELVQVNGIQYSPDTACVQNIKLVRWCSLKVQSFDYHMFKLCSKPEVFHVSFVLQQLLVGIFAFI